jgi:ATP-dependent Clp endopeptidase proteolytic subunit ClpP
MNLDKFKTARSLVALKNGRTDWYKIENKAADVAEVYIYDEIGYFGITASDFVRDLNKVTAKQITLHLNTPGGEVFDGIAIYNALRDHKAPVNVVVDGLAASAGSFIAMAGDTVTMNRNSTMMIHDGHGLVIGNAEDMVEMAELLNKASDNIADIYAKRAKKSREYFRGLMKAETWFTADEAVDAGLADAVAGDEGDATTDNKWDLSIFAYQGREQAPEPKIETVQVTNQDEPEFDLDAFRKALEEGITSNV